MKALAFGLATGPALAADPPGALPPLSRRLPDRPLVVRAFAGGDGPGRPGGELATLVGSDRDTRLMTIYSYTRLIVYDDTFTLQPDLLESYDVEDGRRFTLKLRAGHKWSDGHPFTTEDFRYFWEDMANNAELSPSGPPVELLVDGKPPRVEIVDAHTIRYAWDGPNAYFIESQASAAPLFLFRPAHYLKKFHKKYTPEAEILKSAEGGERGGGWVEVHQRVDAMYADDNVDLPTLNPWVNTTRQPAQRFVFVRNPYFHRIDAMGQQLPYIDRVVFTVAAPSLVPAKAGLNESDLQARYLRMGDYSFLRESAKRFGFQVRLWQVGSGSELALYPNLNARDVVWRGLMRDARFRRALSLAIDRDELNQTIYFGLATPSNNTVMPRSPLFKPEYAVKWATYDPARANRLLDAAGLGRRSDTGVRLLPDGRSATIVVEHTGAQTEESDSLSLIADQWKKIGIDMLAKPQSLDNFRLRAFSGDAIMTAYAGVVTAAPTPDTSPAEFAPTTQGGLQWSRWGMYHQSGGKQGEKCDLPAARSLLDDLRAWERASDAAGRRRAWDDILARSVEEVFSIGTVNGTRQPIVVGPKLRNVPEKGFYAWEPGAYFGFYRPETFWIGG